LGADSKLIEKFVTNDEWKETSDTAGCMLLAMFSDKHTQTLGAISLGSTLCKTFKLFYARERHGFSLEFIFLFLRDQ
jgi:hypothetical protein